MLLVGCQGFAVTLGIAAVDGTIFIDPHGRDLAVGIVGDDLQAIENQGLAHHVKVGTQGIDDVDALLLGIGRQALVVGSLCERIVHRLNETVG